MHRRQYLSLLAAGVAGCGGAAAGPDGTPIEPLGNDTRPTTGNATAGGDANETAGETESHPLTDGTDVRFVDHELVVDEGSLFTTAYVAATVQNIGAEPAGQIQLTAEWYDDNGDYLDSSDAWLTTLGPGETWLARVEALADADEVAEYELTGAFDDEAPTEADGVELVEQNMQASDDEVRVTGRVANRSGDVFDYLEAVVVLYDEAGRVLDDDYTNETDIPADGVWRFTVEFFGFDRADQVAGYDVTLVGNVY